MDKCKAGGSRLEREERVKVLISINCKSQRKIAN